MGWVACSKLGPHVEHTLRLETNGCNAKGKRRYPINIAVIPVICSFDRITLTFSPIAIEEGRVGFGSGHACAIPRTSRDPGACAGHERLRACLRRRREAALYSDRFEFREAVKNILGRPLVTDWFIGNGNHEKRR